MIITEKIHHMAQHAKHAASTMLANTAAERQSALYAIADALENGREQILSANQAWAHRRHD